jgi:hypothetical protein
MLSQRVKRLLPSGTSFCHFKAPFLPDTGWNSEVGWSLLLTDLDLTLRRKGTNERGSLQADELWLRHLGTPRYQG